MAQGRRSRTRGARYRQRVVSGECSGVMRHIGTAPSTATSSQRQSQQQSRGEQDHCGLPSGHPGLVPAPHGRCNRRKNQGEHQQTSQARRKGWDRGKWSRAWHAYRRCGRRNGDGDIRCRTPRRYRVRRNRAGGLRGSPGTGNGHRPGKSPFTAHAQTVRRELPRIDRCRGGGTRRCG